MNARGFAVGCARAFLSACFVACLAAMSFAQAGRGSVNGTITDPNGAVIPGAQVELLNKATGVTLHTVASSAGLYTFISLNPGVYQVKASQTGFASVAQEKVRVDVDQSTEVNITLRVGAATETVTVTETGSLVEASNSTVGSLIPAEQIDRVPLLYRNVFDLIQLSAGVIPVNGSPNSSDSMQSVQNISVGRPGVDVSADTINGSLVGSVYYMLDGAPLGIAENNAAAIIPAMNIPEDGVDEVKVETQNTPASYQSGAAGVISLVSKSGTNKFHGDVFGVFRPSALSANEYFTKRGQISNNLPNKPPDFHRYQEGGAIGGPIKKDKLFFFADYEHTTQQQFEGNLQYQVPTSAERTGDFSNFLNNIDPNTNLPAPVVIYDPTQPDDASGNRIPFTGNKITNPNPIGLLYLSNMPKCNYPTPAVCEAATTDNTQNPNFQLPGLDPFTANKFDARVDWNASDKQRIFTRFSYDKLVFSTANVFPAPGWDPDYALNTTNARNAIIADDVTLSSSTVLQLRYSFTRHFEKQGGPASYLSNDITTQGFPAALASQVVFHQIPFMNFDDVGGGVGGTADYNNFVYASMNSDVNAAVTKVKGKHELSFGFEWMKRYLNVGQPPAPAGAYAFDVSATNQSIATGSGGSDYASLLIGMGEYPGSEQNDYPNFTKDVFAAESNPYYAAFFEDTFHASKTLTITAGLRWDIFGGRNERYNRQEYFNPATTNTVGGVAYTGAEIYVNGSHRSPFKTGLHDFGPRLAFAWQPLQHFVVRGGAGFYYGPATHNVASAGQNSDGFASQSPWAATCINGDGNTVYNGTSCGNQNVGSPLDNFTVDYSLSNPFAGPVGGPGGIIPVFTTAPAGLANNLGNTVFSVLQAQRTPTTYNFNFGVEYELPHQVVVSAAYVGSRGLFLPLGSVDLNQLDLGTIAKYGAQLCVDTSNPACVTEPYTGPVSLNPNLDPAVTQLPGVPLWATLQQFPQFGNGNYGNGVVISGIGGGDSEYSSLQTKVQKRLTGHFTTLATFTWGKLMTDDSNPPLGFVGSHNGSVQDWRNLRYDHSIAPQDVKYQFTGQMSYDLPFGKGMAVNLSGVANAFAGGWTANAIVYLSTGVPINSPGSGTPSPSYFNQRADMTCNPASGAPHTVDHWFNVDCFAQPGGAANPNRLVPGTAPDYLDNVRTRGARDLDLSIYKSFKFGETKALRFDISGYNMSNTPQYGYPSVHSVFGVQVQGENFGKIGKTINTPRQYQFGASFKF